MNAEEALKFCQELAKTGKYEGDGHEFKDLAFFFEDYIRMNENYGKYEYICDRMSSDEYYELESEYEAECEKKRKKTNEI